MRLLFGRLVAALDHIGAELRRQNNLNVLDTEVTAKWQADQRQMMAIQQAQLASIQAQNERALEARAVWEKTEREHMKACEKRYHMLVGGQPSNEPVKH